MAVPSKMHKVPTYVKHSATKSENILSTRPNTVKFIQVYLYRATNQGILKIFNIPTLKIDGYWGKSFFIL